MTSPRQAFVGAGANLGDRAGTLRAALGRLHDSPATSVLEISALYETEPLGVEDQPDFLNLVAGVETTLTPEGLLARLLEIEREFGRVRVERWGPRTLDLDLLAFEGETRDLPGLQLPHPRLFERAFVVVPLQDVLSRAPFRRACWAELNRRLAAATPLGRVTRQA